MARAILNEQLRVKLAADKEHQEKLKSFSERAWKFIKKYGGPSLCGGIPEIMMYGSQHLQACIEVHKDISGCSLLMAERDQLNSYRAPRVQNIEEIISHLRHAESTSDDAVNQLLANPEVAKALLQTSTALLTRKTGKEIEL